MAAIFIILGFALSSADECTDCHKDNMPALFQQWEMSKHALNEICDHDGDLAA